MSSCVDFLVELFDRGLHSLLEDIILNLPPRTVQICQDVSQAWRSIVNFYLESKNLRAQRIKKKQIDKEWILKGPILHPISLEDFNIRRVAAFHIISVEDLIVIAANINDTKTAKVLVIDSRSLRVTNVLDVTDSNGENVDVLEIKLAMDTNFLVAYVHEEQTNDNLYYYRVWNRKHKFSDNPLKPKCRPESRKFITKRLANIPFLVDGLLMILVGQFNEADPKRQGLVYYELNLTLNTMRRLEIPIPNNIAYDFWYQQRDNSGNVYSVNTIEETGRNELILTKADGIEYLLDQRNSIPEIVGYSPDYVAVYWNGRPCDRYILYNIDYGIRWKEYYPFGGKTNIGGNLEVQMSSNRIAVMGKFHPPARITNVDLGLRLLRDVKIDDISRKRTLVSDLICGADLGLNYIEHFLLLHDGIVAENLGQIIIAKFCAIVMI